MITYLSSTHYAMIVTMTPRTFASDRLITGALCYLIQEGRVLMMKRAHMPHQGQWSAPGGKMELGESPDECVIRELQEETGLTILNPQLCGVMSVTDVAYPIHWMLFIYRAHAFTGTLEQLDTEEGLLAWLPIAELDGYDMPSSDRQCWPYVLNFTGTVFRAKFLYHEPDTMLEAKFY